MTVTGLAELEKKMHELGPKLARQALRASVNAGAQIIKKDAQARAPQLTGTLKKEIFVKRARESCTQTKECYIIGVRKWHRPAGGSITLTKEYFVKGVRKWHRPPKKDRDAYYWRFLEFGTVFMAAHPFLVPAFETKKEEAANAIKQKLADKIQSLAQEKYLTRRIF